MSESNEIQKPVETLVTPIVGWRLWHMSVDGSQLFSLNATHVEWEPKKRLVAQCSAGGGTQYIGNGTITSEIIHKTDNPVHPKCSCGIWAYKSPEDLLAYDIVASPSILDFFQVRSNWGCYKLTRGTGETREYRDFETVQVLGEVYLWGKVMVHQQGYRAQYACVKQLHYVLKYDKFMKEALPVEPEIDAKWRNETWHTSENLTTKLPSILSGHLMKSQQAAQIELERLSPSQPASQLVFRSSQVTLAQLQAQLVKHFPPPAQAQPSAQVQPSTQANVPVNRSIPKGQEEAVEHKQKVAKSSFWKTISGRRVLGW
jgi:hypothetical protein